MLQRLLIVSLVCSISSSSSSFGEWKRHVIDGSSRGADGVRVGDINGDGLPDFATGWEEGGVIRVYQHPGTAGVMERWPVQTVGNVKSAEDAVFVDLDNDGKLDVVSCCEGKTKTVFVHWSPQQPLQEKWQTEAFPKLAGNSLWMFAAPLDIDQKHGADLVIAAKGPKAQIGWLESPEKPRDLTAWQWHKLFDVGWVMSIMPVDMDADGDLDILYSDRKGQHRGVHWLEYDSTRNLKKLWARHTIGGTDREVMFLALGDLDHDGLQDVACTVKGSPITWFRRTNQTGTAWEEHEINMPPDTGGGKGVSICDVDKDGVNDVVFTCEHSDKLHGVGWLSQQGEVTSASWDFHEISGKAKGAGIKFDLIQTLDLDQDGDLDIITCEERDQLGVIWYENPLK